MGFRRRMTAVMAAVALLAGGLLVPAAQADELSDLKTAESAAKAAYDKAVKKRDALKPARDSARATLDEGTVGYFRARGATDAVRILTDDGTLTGHDYAADVRKAKAEGDSDTHLDSMLRGLEAIRRMNEFRAEEGTSPKDSNVYLNGGGKTLNPLLVTDGLMAVAEVHGDRIKAEGNMAHHMDFGNSGQNICGSDEDGLTACYYVEKENYATHNGGKTGHYLNIVNDEFRYVGSGDSFQEFDLGTPDTDDKMDFWIDNAQGNTTVLSQGRVMSVDDYEKDVDAYKAPLDKAVSDYDKAAKTATDAKNAYDKAKADADAASKTYTVSFDPCNGQLISGRSVHAGQPVAEPKTPTRDGYTFNGWYTAKTGGDRYDFSTPVNADLNLYAHWTAQTPRTYTVTFDAKGGTTVGRQKVGDGGTVAEPAAPTRDGYVFQGWYKDDAKYDFSTPVHADMTLTARWKTAGQSKPAVKDGWVVENGVRHWYENGRMARSHAFYDRASDAWYWADADGTIARDKDVFIPRDETDRSKGGKWVRFDRDSRMVKGEQYSTRRNHVGWYWFDPTSGEMAHGMRHVPSNGGKWVYYDATTGIMAHGERYVDYDKAHTGWYLFDRNTGAMAHGDVYVRSNGGKWVRYDHTTGIMVHGLQYRDGSWYYFDRTTGAMAHGRTWVPDWRAWHDFDPVTGRG